MSIIKVLDLEDRVQLLSALFNQLDDPPTKTQLFDIVSCISMEEIIEYMRDVGITITHSSLSTTLIQATINEDKGWINKKVQVLLDHFLSKI